VDVPRILTDPEVIAHCCILFLALLILHRSQRP
jgi:hypothetical protein